jgi:hypothetical protein
MDNQMNDDDTPLAEAELTRLADGSLPDSEREHLRGRVAASQELADRLAEQSRAVSLMRSTDDVGAPASLRASIEEMTAGPARSGGAGRARAGRARSIGSWRPRLLVPIAAVAAIVVALVIVLGGSARPTVAQTGHLALAAATIPAPSTDPANRDVLALRGAGIAFPSYQRTSDWVPTGARHDSLDGRAVTTVFYRAGVGAGARVGYSIVAGAALAYPSGRSQTDGGVRYVFTRLGSATLVTWRRQRHTCVIAGRGVDDRTLLSLAVADSRA